MLIMIMGARGERPTQSAQPKAAIRLAALSCRHDLLPDPVVIMIQHESKVCLFCEGVFEPHPKVGSRQLACKKWDCKRQRLKRTKKLWYDKDPACNYSYVKKFRHNHPDYQKQWRQKRKQQRQAQANSPSVEAKPGSLVSLKASPAESDGRSLPLAGEIRNQLTLTKTTTQLDLFRAGEIRNQLSLCITLPLTELLTLCTQPLRGEIRNQSSA